MSVDLLSQSKTGLKIDSVPFQSGPTGFVRYGIDRPIDFLFLAALGGRGGGKTEGGVKRDVYYMHKFPKSHGMIVSQTYGKITDTIMPKMHKVFEELGQKYGDHWEYNKMAYTLSHISGSLIYMRSAEEPDKIPGPDLAWFHMDEFRSQPLAVWQKVLPTLRQQGYPRQAVMTSTPAGTAHWYRRIWFPKQYAIDFPDEPDYPRLEGKYIKYSAPTTENPNLPKGFVDMLISTYGYMTPLYRQEVQGEDVIVEGLVLDAWNPLKHVVTRENWPVQNPETVIGGFDFGFQAHSVLSVVGRDRAGRTYMMDEYGKQGLSEYDLASIAKRKQEEYGITAFVADSADPRWIASLRHHLKPLPVYPVKKVIKVGGDFSSTYALFNYIMNKDVDGKQGFFCDPRCTMFRRQVENLVWKERKDGELLEQVKGKRDALDAARYVIMALEHPRISRPSQWESMSMSIGG